MPVPSSETLNMVARAAAVWTWSDEMNISRVSGVGICEDADDEKRRRVRLAFDVAGSMRAERNLRFNAGRCFTNPIADSIVLW